MRTKVFNDGQIVIPRAIRKAAGIHVGDEIEVTLDSQDDSIEIHKTGEPPTEQLAGVFAKYARKKSFPDKGDMEEALARGIGHGIEYFCLSTVPYGTHPACGCCGYSPVVWEK